MTTSNTQENKHFCIYDYFLDGVFLRWEEVKGNCPVLVSGQDWVISLEDGTEMTTKVTGTETISENERRIFLSSGDN